MSLGAGITSKNISKQTSKKVMIQYQSIIGTAQQQNATRGPKPGLLTGDTVIVIARPESTTFEIIKPSSSALTAVQTNAWLEILVLMTSVNTV